MWGTAVISVVGGVLLAEMIYARKKARGEWRTRPQDQNQQLSGSQIWFRSIARVVLVALLAGLPLVVKGGLAIVGFGVVSGISLNGLIRAITNRLPWDEKDTTEIIIGSNGDTEIR